MKKGGNKEKERLRYWKHVKGNKQEGEAVQRGKESRLEEMHILEPFL